MAHPRYLDLCTGADSRLRQLEWLAWLGATLTFLMFHGSLPPIALAAGLGLLASLRPWRTDRDRPASLRLFADGSALLDGADGAWTDGHWHAAGLCVLTVRLRTALPAAAGRDGFRTPARLQQPMRLLVCRTLNHPDDFRRLRTWLRFDPRPLDSAGDLP